MRRDFVFVPSLHGEEEGVEGMGEYRYKAGSWLRSPIPQLNHFLLSLFLRAIAVKKRYASLIQLFPYTPSPFFTT